MVNEMYKCKNCGHQIKRYKGRYRHVLESSPPCTTNFRDNKNGLCGGLDFDKYYKHGIIECIHDHDCNKTHLILKNRCSCGCKYPRPKYSLIKRILYCVFGIRSKPS